MAKKTIWHVRINNKTACGIAWDKKYEVSGQQRRCKRCARTVKR